MTDSKVYTVRGAQVTVTATLWPGSIDLHITVDTSVLDKDEPEHSGHDLIHYLDLPGYSAGQAYWWCKIARKTTVQSGSQAQRVIKHALTRIDDALHAALIARAARKAHLSGIFA